MNMETIVLLLVGLSALALAVVGIVVVRKEPVTIGTILDATEGGLTDIERAAGAAKKYVLAAEQLWQTGRMDKDNRLYFVVSKLKAVFPDIAEETLEDSVEAAVAWMKLGEGRLISSGEEQPTER